MKKIIKILFPERIKKCLRKTENIFFRLRYGFTKPIVLQDIHGVRFLLYPEEKTPIRWSVERGAYKKECSAMDKLVKPGDIVFDVGSHIGVIACYLRTRTGETGEVYAFEPFPKSFQRLCENVTLNGYKNVTTNNLAVSDVVGISKFYYEPKDYQLNSLGKVSNGTNQLSASVDVKTETIDSYCGQNKITKIDFLKIDTEGFEINVLKGAEKMLNDKRIEIIQFEISKTPLESLGRTPDEIVGFLKSKGYETFEYVEETGAFREIETITSGYDNFYASYNDLIK